MPKPPVVVEMSWTRELEFSANLAHASLVLDSHGRAGGSPVDLLAASLAGCMAMDLAHILNKGRHVYRAISARLVAERAPDIPHRITSATLHFVVIGAVPGDAIGRAIQLSHEKYCSVWHSMRQDIDLRVTFDVEP